MTMYGCCCDRCGRVYETNVWPAASLCLPCDIEKSGKVWTYPTYPQRGRLVKSAAEIRGAA